MDLVGARSLNPLGVRHIEARMPRAEVSCPLVLFATVCLATAESLCLFEINGLLLRIFAHAKSAGCLLCCKNTSEGESDLLVRKRVSWCKCKLVGLIEHWIGIRSLRDRPAETNNLRHMFNVR
ncbi:hypothetical protein T07_5193 [Trichinella nelsoni]|uniref:Uncharacterized protein n=1 Tax=Trichinella nelsoni TaxID=6336 RepID=A0A0V0RUF7_9BILA|nr:hypothetical protein T07_5193 [Trichinella nelsoni]